MVASLNGMSNSTIASISDAIAQIDLDEFRGSPLFSGVDGAGYSVVIIDSGIDLDHPLFGPNADGNETADRIVTHYDFSGTNDPDASDTIGHGSNVSSIAAVIAPGANIIHLKVFPDGKEEANEVDVKEALNWVIQNAQQYNIASVNLSLADKSLLTAPTPHPFNHGELQALHDAGIPVIAAAGNDYHINPSPGVADYAADPFTIAVGAVNTIVADPTTEEQLADFSRRDPNLLDILAPGTNIDGADSNGGFVSKSGTSQAAPHIAGIAALAQQLAAQQLGRRLTVAEFRDLLKTTGVTVNDASGSYRRVDVLGLGDGILTAKTGTLPTAQNDVLVGTAEDDRISAFEGDDSLNGSLGNDTLIGGAGKDTFVVKPNEGADIIQDFNRQEGDRITFEAPAQAEQFRYDAQTGELFFDNQVLVTLANSPDEFSVGTDGTDLVFQPVPEQPIDPIDPIAPPPPSGATEGDDILAIQNPQGDSLQGLGGNDRMTGGAGNDTLDGGAGNDSLVGGAGDDTLLGQDGNDTLDGGIGNDALSGGLGDDSYLVDSSTDVITEAINAGTDKVSASIGYTLADNVEHLTLTGNNAIDGSGNSLNNTIIGNAANNYLYAGDGADQADAQAGDDYLYGQAGDDLLNGGTGRDWLIGDLGDDVLSGGTGDDRLVGGLGTDSLTGDRGKDRLTGGADADRFIFNSPRHGFDVITDFQAAQGDQLVVSAQGLGTNLRRGRLSAARFTLGSKANDDQAGFVYNRSSGALFFDADGTGNQRQFQVAKLVAGSSLSANQIVIA